MIQKSFLRTHFLYFEVIDQTLPKPPKMGLGLTTPIQCILMVTLAKWQKEWRKIWWLALLYPTWMPSYIQMLQGHREDRGMVCIFFWTKPWTFVVSYIKGRTLMVRTVACHTCSWTILHDNIWGDVGPLFANGSLIVTASIYWALMLCQKQRPREAE